MHSSQALRKFENLIALQGEQVVRKFLNVDLDRNGAVVFHGVKAALLYPEFKITEEEIKEVFDILNRGGQFYYRDYILQRNPSLRPLLLDISTPSLPPTLRSEHPLDASTSRFSKQSTVVVDENKLKAIKNKIKSYIQTQDISLSILFNIMDTDSNKSIDKMEFRSRIQALKINIDTDDIDMLFKSIDRDSSGTITYIEFCKEFEEINSKISMVISNSPILDLKDKKDYH